MDYTIYNSKFTVIQFKFVSSMKHQPFRNQVSSSPAFKE